MKNRFLLYIAVCLLSIIGFSSCSDYLDKRPDDQLDIKTAFENSGNLRKWLAYIYDGIPKYYADSNWDAIADDANTPWEWTGVGNKTRNYLFGNWTPSDGQLINYWMDFPKRIRSAYIFIENAHPLPDVSQSDIDVMKAECRFFIAYYHSVLVMTYGSVPLIKEAAPTTTENDVNLKQRPFYEVVDWCDNEFMEVAKELPSYYTDMAKDYGRATSLWALAMRARMLTFAASPLVNGNPDMAGVVNCDGEPIFSTQYDPYRWDYAAKANMELIEAAEANDYKLYEVVTKEGEHDAYMSYFGSIMLRRNENNFEVIMPRTEEGAGWMDLKAAPKSIKGEAGVYGVTQELVDAFFMKNGQVPITGYKADGSPIINPDSKYTETGFSTADMTDKTAYFYNNPKGIEGLSENVITEANTFNMYCNREPRFYVSVMYNDSFNWAKTHKDRSEATPPRKNVNFYFNGEDGKSGSDYPTAGYLMKKRIAPDYTGSSNGKFNKRHGAIYRLAEAYLAYAECLYEFSVSDGIGQYATNQAEIFKYVNRIRKRAGIPEYGSNGLNVPSEQEARSLIQRERRIELNCESGLRWNDVRRWKIAKDVLEGPVYGMNMMATTKEAYYVRTKYQEERKLLSYWWPVPQDDMDRNPNLRQLPGW